MWELKFANFMSCHLVKIKTRVKLDPSKKLLPSSFFYFDKIRNTFSREDNSRKLYLQNLSKDDVKFNPKFIFLSVGYM